MPAEAAGEGARVACGASGSPDGPGRDGRSFRSRRAAGRVGEAMMPPITEVEAAMTVGAVFGGVSAFLKPRLLRSRSGAKKSQVAAQSAPEKLAEAERNADECHVDRAHRLGVWRLA